MQDKENQAWLMFIKLTGILYEASIVLSVGMTCLASGLIIHALLKKRR